MKNKTIGERLEKSFSKFFESFTLTKAIAISIIVLGTFIVYTNTSQRWQDYVFMVGGFVLTFTLLPTILSKQALVPRWTSVTSATVVFSFACTFLYMSLHLSFIGNFINFLAWSYIALYRGVDINGEFTNSFKQSFTTQKIVGIISIYIILGVIYVFTTRAIPDYIFMFGAIILTASLVPTILSRNARIPRWTSVPALMVIGVFSISFFTLDLYLSSIANAINSTAWIYIAIFRGPEY